MATRGRARVDLARLGEILNAYGAEERRWPKAERSAARALVAASPHAAALRAEAARLDRLLDRVMMPGPTPALVSAIVTAADPAERGPLQRISRFLQRTRPFGASWRSALALALAALLGVGAGFGGIMQVGSSGLSDPALGHYGELEE